jgi:predicted flap endonuclease-1-like 5' DNA nuclease
MMTNQASIATIPYEELQRSAYLNYLDRTSKGLPGSETDDWEKARIHLERKIQQSRSSSKLAKAPGKSSQDSAITVKLGVDSLRLLAGLGPKIESRLQEAGITSLKQIASWKAEEVEEISKKLKLGARIVREKWVEQAKALLKR